MKAAIWRFVFAAAVAMLAVGGGGTTAWGQATCPTLNYPDFSLNQNCLQLNGAPAPLGSIQFVNAPFQLPTGVSGTTVLQLTNSTGNQVGSAWYTTPQPVENGFTTTFWFQFNNSSTPPADGIAFVIQNSSANISAIGFTGGNGGALGYGDDDNNTNPSAGEGIPNSLAIEFDNFQNPWDPPPSASGNISHVAIQSCGTGPNTSHHGHQCGGDSGANSTVATATLTSAAFGAGLHMVTISYSPPSPGTAANIQVTLDGNSILGANYDLSNIGLGTLGTAYVGFTGATGADYETQDILNWTFSAPTQSVQAGGLTQGQVTTATFNSTPNEELIHTLELPSSSSNTMVCNQNGVSMPQLLSYNLPVSNNGGVGSIQQYTYMTPFANGLLFEQEADDLLAGGPGFGSLILDECYQSGMPPSTASLLSCPVVNLQTPASASPNQLINVTEQFNFPSATSLPPIAQGTTVSLLHHPGQSVASTTMCNGTDALLPTVPWQPVPSGATSNPVCTNVQIPGSPTYQCDLEDALLYDPAIESLSPTPYWGVFGDQTGTGGGLKSRGVFGVMFDISMLTTQVSVNGKALNRPGVQDTSGVHWFNTSSLGLNFLVNPATTTNPTNGWYAAPINSLAWVFYNNSSPEPLLPAPPNCPQPPEGSTCMLNSGTPGAFTNGVAAPVDFVDSAPLNPLNNNDGLYTLAWSARDTVDIGERNIQLLTGSSTCPNPNGMNPPPTPPCYSTTLFNEQIGIDTHSPTITATLSPHAPYTTNGVPTYLLNQPVTVTYTCADPLSNGVASGVATCGVGAPSSLSTSATGSFSFMATATDVAGNQGSTTVSYDVVNEPAALALLPFVPLSVNPGSNLVYGFAGLNLGPDPAIGVVVTAPVPTGTTFVKAFFVVGPCTSSGCAIPAAGTACTLSGSNIICNIGSLGLLKNLTGVGIAIEVSVPASAAKGQMLTETATISSLNSNPNPSKATATKTTKVN
jgi:uncharacterized repeat protein (TIGR01451 family)